VYASEGREACAAVGEDGCREEIGWAARHRPRPRTGSVATVSRVCWNPRRAPDPKPIHIHEPVRPYLQSSSLSQPHKDILHASHHPDQLVHHRLELFAAPLHPTDLVPHICEHFVHIGLRVGYFPVSVTHVYVPFLVPFLEVDPSCDLAGTDAFAECEDALDVTLQRRHFVALRRDFACHQDRRECLGAVREREVRFGSPMGQPRKRTFNSKCR
jgi:hypothetical protein